MMDKTKDEYAPEDICPYCGYNEASKKCQSCGERFCTQCVDEQELCPYCSGRDMLQKRGKF